MSEDSVQPVMVVEQPGTSSASMELLGQSQLEGAVLIYDSNSQDENIKLVTSMESNNAESMKSCDEMADLITLHASIDANKGDLEDNINLNVMDESGIDSNSSTVEKANETAEKGEAILEKVEGEGDSDDDDDDDDETIATFVTSTGQQLALYAVENSDQVFAVALYDESGVPPTNFHFVMKDDVERLIEEGAVRTVKKKSVQPVQLSESQPIPKNSEVSFQVTPEAKLKPKESQEASKKQEIQSGQKTPQRQEILPKPHTQPKQVSPVKSVLAPAQVSPVKQTTIMTATTANASSPKAVTIAKLVSPPKPAPQPKQEVLTKKATGVQREAVEMPGLKKASILQRSKPAPAANRAEKIDDIIYSAPKKPKVVRGKPVEKVIGNVFTTQITKQCETSVAYIVTDKNEAYILDRPQEEIDSDTEILEQSTVQYILCDANSDDELTFDELQRSLQSFNKTSTAKSKIPEQSKPQQRTSIVKFPSNVTPKVRQIIAQKKPSPSITMKSTMVPLVRRTYSNPRKSAVQSNSSSNQFMQVSNIKIKKELPDDYDEIFADNSAPSESENDASTHSGLKADDEDDVCEGGGDSGKRRSNENSTTPNEVGSQSPAKIKRSRKQQLTAVNRPDSEIIIQPASVYSEEEGEPASARKRGRRKKRTTPDPDYSPRKPGKRGRRPGHRRSYEIIEIDVEEVVVAQDGADANAVAGSSGKTKGSSDKENNDVISVGSSEDENNDSDEEDSEGEESRRREVIRKKSRRFARGKKSISSVKCGKCARTFATQRSLAIHLHTCAKKVKPDPGRNYSCKTCGESFKAALVLARHVRMNHSPKKTKKRVGRPPKRWSRDDRSEITTEDEEEDEEEEEEASMSESSEPEAKLPKKRGRPPTKKSTGKEDSPASDFSLKLDSSTELESKRQRGGRPALTRRATKERSMSIDLDEKSTSEPRRRGRPGRPRKRSISSKDERSVSPEAKEQRSVAQIPKKRGRQIRRTVSKDDVRSVHTPMDDESAEPRDKDPQSGEESAKESEKKDKAGENDKVEKKSPQKENKDEAGSSARDDQVVEVEEDIDTDNVQKKDKPTSDESKEAPEAEAKKSESAIDEESAELGEKEEKEPQTGNKPPTKLSTPEPEETSKDESDAQTKSSKVQTTEDKSKEKDSPSDSRKRSRPATSGRKDSEVGASDDDDEKQQPKKMSKGEEDKALEEGEVSLLEEEEVEGQDGNGDKKDGDEKRSAAQGGSGRSWKVKKLNCADCGKWFASATALDTHRLQHTTKKTSKLVQRCRLCKKFVPVEVFAKHMATTHKKTTTSTPALSSTPPSSSLSSRPISRQSLAAQPKRLVSPAVGAKRPNVRQLRSSN